MRVSALVWSQAAQRRPDAMLLRLL